MKIEYVASAFINYGRLKHVDREDEEDEMWPVLQNMISRVQREFAPDIEVGFLYNSFTEPDIGELTKSLGGDHTYADSGGLQMVTTEIGRKLGDKIHAEKTKVFFNQAEVSDYGFSFDELPMKKISETAFGVGGSVFVRELCEPYGYLAGKNLLEQYNIYKETETKCKIIPIVQGADSSTTKAYCRGLFNSLPDDFVDSCRGIALGGINTANIYAPVTLMHSVMNVEDPTLKKLMKQGIHLLGVGSLSKIVGILLLAENDHLNIDVLTIDSASISKDYFYGSIKYFNESGILKSTLVGTKLNAEIVKIYKEIYAYFEEDLKPLYPTYEEYMKNNIYDKEFKSVPNKERTPRERNLWYILIASYALYDLRNTVKAIHMMVFDKIPFDKIINLKPKDRFYMQHLEKCKTPEQVQEWINIVNSKSLNEKVIVDTEADALKMGYNPIEEWL